MAESNEDEGIISKVFSAISAIFAPLLPALAGSGILRGLLILAVQLGMIKEGSGTYTILYSTSMAVFYFLPVLLALHLVKDLVMILIFQHLLGLLYFTRFNWING